MSIGKICRGEAVTATKNTSLQEAAKLMMTHNVGMLVIVETKDAQVKPIGVLTDRRFADILAENTDVNKITVGDIMSWDLLVLKVHQGIHEAVDMMCAKGVRRAPVIDDHNKLIGVVSLDDLIVLIADELGSIAKLIRKQVE